MSDYKVTKRRTSSSTAEAMEHWTAGLEQGEQVWIIYRPDFHVDFGYGRLKHGYTNFSNVMLY